MAVKKNSGGSNFCIKFVKLYQGGVLPEHFRELGGGSGSGSNDKWTSGDRNNPLLSDVLSRGRLSQIELTGGKISGTNDLDRLNPRGLDHKLCWPRYN